MIADLNLLGHQSFRYVKIKRINKLGMDFLEVISPVYKESSRKEVKRMDGDREEKVTEVRIVLMNEKVEGLFSYNSLYSITNIRSEEEFWPEKIEELDDLPF